MIKRGHTNTALPDDAIDVVFKVSMRQIDGCVYTGYGYVAFVPQCGLITNCGGRSKDYRKTWFDCMKDILECVPKNSTVMVHTRFRNFVSLLVGGKKRLDSTDKELRWKERIVSLCDKKGVTLYMHTLHAKGDGLERKAARIARKMMRKQIDVG